MVKKPRTGKTSKRATVSSGSEQEDTTEALRRIREVSGTTQPVLDLSRLAKLRTLPGEISDLTHLIVISLDGTRVSDLSPLANLTSLKRLWLSSTAVDDIGPLSHLTGLERLRLGGTLIADLSPLVGLSFLQELWLNGTKVTKLSPIAHLNILTSLRLNSTAVTDLGPLTNLLELKSLSLDFTKISDLTPLTKLTSLEELSLVGTGVTDLSPLAHLEKLQTLSLRNTAVNDLSALTRLSALQTLRLDYTNVKNLSPLRLLDRLDLLHLDGTQIADLSALANKTSLADAVMASDNRLAGLYFRDSKATRSKTESGVRLKQLAELDNPARTVETINFLRRQQRMPEYWPDPYERTEVRSFPSEPLPAPSPATQFVIHDKIDVVPPAAWSGSEARAAAYYNRARELGAKLSSRLTRTDAARELAVSVNALLAILGDNVASLQPDQLRMAYRSLASAAQTYSHIEAKWDLSSESVSQLLELTGVLQDLQGFVSAELVANAQAIQTLDLTLQAAASVKEGLDEVATAARLLPELFSETAQKTFESAQQLSDAATDPNSRVSIESERILQAGNLGLAVARDLTSGGDKKPPKKPRQPRQPPERPKKPTPERDWTEFVDRVLQRIHDAGPNKLADSIMRNPQKSILTLSALLTSLGGMLAMLPPGTPLAIAIAWIAYELRRRGP